MFGTRARLRRHHHVLQTFRRPTAAQDIRRVADASGPPRPAAGCAAASATHSPGWTAGELRRRVYRPPIGNGQWLAT